MTNMPTAEFLRFVDQAATKNDRWLFLAALCLLLFTCALIIHWLVKQLQLLLTSHKEATQNHKADMVKIINSQNETALKLAVCIDRNTNSMESCQHRAEILYHK